MSYFDARLEDLSRKGLLRSILRELIQIKHILFEIGEEQVEMDQELTQDLDDLKGQVAQTQGVEQSAIALINGLGTKLDAALATNGGDPAAVKQAVTDFRSSLQSSANDLAAAVAARSGSATDPNPVPQQT